MKFWHRVQLPDGTYTPGFVNHGPDGGDWSTTRFGMPEDLTGKYVLDIGAWDGFFSFEAEKRGAKFVQPTNPRPPKHMGDNLDHIKNLLNSKIQPQAFLDIENNDDIDSYFMYDIVLFYGILYHLKNPIGAIENLYKLIKPGGIILLETAMATDIPESPALLEYAPGRQDDPTNHFYPNKLWIETAAKTAGFVACEQIYHQDNRATFRLRK